MKIARLLEAMAGALLLWTASLAGARAADPTVERGKYLAAIGGCADCHTPGHFLGNPDHTRELGGSDVGFEIPKRGVFYGPNLTMDKETGLGRWTEQQIAAAITTGVRPDGRQLANIMPWKDFAVLTKPDVAAIVAYLKSLPPVKNKVPGPFGPLQVPTASFMRIIPAEPGDAKIDIGSTLAERWCKGCHDVARTPATAAAGGPPPFKTIAQRLGPTPEMLDQFLSSSHTRMPDFSLSPYERSLLIAYISSLQ